MVTPSPLAMKRQERHQAIRQLVLDNKLDQAALAFKQAIFDFGPHVGLLCDWAGCYYEAGRFQECWAIVERTAKEFNEAYPVLSEDSKRRTALMLAKFYEEMAEPSIALEWLNYGKTFCESFEDKKWILLQELRILSYFSQKENLSKRYVAATDFFKTDDNLSVETQHSLMWTEAALFGFEHAKSRWVQLQKMPLNFLDQRLILRDFIEIGILLNKTTDRSFAFAADQLKNLNQEEYDRYLLGLQKAGFSVTDLDAYKLSDMMKIRLVLLSIKLETSTSLQFELKKKFWLLIESRSNASRALFKNLEPFMGDTRQIAMTLLTFEKRIALKSFPYSQVILTDLQTKFLKETGSKSEMTLDQIAKVLWGMEGDETAYHRLRMIVYKLNEKLLPLVGSNAFDIKKGGLRMNPQLFLDVKNP